MYAHVAEYDLSLFSSPLMMRKTPAKLFTPSGSGDYLRPSTGNSPIGGGKRGLQMQKQFSKLGCQSREIEGGAQVGRLVGLLLLGHGM